MISRRSVLKGLAGVTLSGLFVAAYGFFVEPALRLRIQRWRIARSDWTARPLRIAVLSDIHLGEPYMGLRRLRRIVRRANGLGADLILLLGDYAKGHHFLTEDVQISDAAPILAELAAPLGVFGVLGNHDWWDDPEAQAREAGPCRYATELSAQGIPILSNRAVFLPDAGVWLAGLEDQVALLRGSRPNIGLDDLPGTLAQITNDAPVILMAHEPDIFAQVPDRVALTLCGHTHGGQVRLFGWAPVVPSRYGQRFAYGHVREGVRDLVVSGGLGCSILPVRFGIAPEITVIEIARA